MKFSEIKERLDKTIELAFLCKNEIEEEVVYLSDFEIEDLAYSEEEMALKNYLETLTGEEVHAIMSIMYLGRDGYIDTPGDADMVLNDYISSIDKKEKELEIDTMLGKFVLYDYLAKARYLLMSI